VAEHARALLGVSPEIFPVSARLALKSKQGDASVWAASGFEALESYLASTLDAPGRVQLKLLNPLGVGAAITDRHGAIVRDRLELLKEDVEMLEEVEAQLAVYQQDLGRDFELRMAEIDKILIENGKEPYSAKAPKLSHEGQLTPGRSVPAGQRT